VLDSALTEHLGYKKHSPIGKNSGNSRNLKTYKALKNDNGEIDIAVPRDRSSSFDPQIAKKYEQTLEQMTALDVQAHILEFY